MQIIREFPPNPNIVNYYTRQQLTTRMSERYIPGRPEYPHEIIRLLSEIPGITSIHLLRHKLRIKKDGDVEWDSMIPEIEQVLQKVWKTQEIIPGEREDIRRSFRLPEGIYFEKRAVFEGVNQSQQHPLAEKVFRIHGIATAIFYQDQLTIKRSCCFPWDELSPQIVHVLSEFVKTP